MKKDQSYFHKRYSALDKDRQTFMSHWKELSENFSPRSGRFDLSDANQGGKKHNKLYNNKPLRCADILSSGMMSGITSPARPWFRLGLPDTHMAEHGAISEYLHTCTQLMLSVFGKSNIYQALPMMYKNLGVFASAGGLILDDDEKVIRAQTLECGGFLIAQNEAQIVDTLYREFRISIRQLVLMFGYDNVSEGIQRRYKEGNKDEKIDVVHVIEPRTERELGKADNLNMPFVSVYYEKGKASSNTEGAFISESGFNEFPGMFPRWGKQSDDVYGTDCPGMESLGDAKQLQLMEKRNIQIIDKITNPPMNAPSSMKNSKPSVLPGDVNYQDVNQGNLGFSPAYQIDYGVLNPLREKIHSVEERIEAAFYTDLFLMISQMDRAQITATEIAERKEEKLLMLGPVLERIHTDLLDPIIDRTFAIMNRRGMLPPPPQELSDGTSLKVEYISVLAQAQRAVGLSSIDRLAGFSGNLLNLTGDPSTIDKLDTDQMIDSYAEGLGVPPDLVLSDEKVAKKRAGRAQQQQMQEMAQAAPAMKDMAQAAKAASEINNEKGSPLDNILGGLGG